MQQKITKYKHRYLETLKGFSIFVLGVSVAIPGFFYFTKPALATLSTDAIGTYEAKTVGDFDQGCATKTNIDIVDHGKTMVMMRPWVDPDSQEFTVANVFNNTGAYRSGYSFTPSSTDGIVNFTGVNGSFGDFGTSTSYAGMEFRAKFTSNWQDIGLVDYPTSGIDSATVYLVFSTKNDGQLYARYKNNSGTVIDQALGSAYVGEYQTFRIVRRDNEGGGGSEYARFFINGVIVAESTTKNTNNLLPLISNKSMVSGGDLFVDWAIHETYNTGYSQTPNYISCAIDSGSTNTVWGNISYDRFLENPYNAQFEVATSTSNDGVSWSSYTSPLENGTKISSPKGRYLKYKVTMWRGSTYYKSPYLSSIKIDYIKTTSSTTGSVYNSSSSDFDQNCATKTNVLIDKKISGELSFNPLMSPTSLTLLNDQFENSSMSNTWTSGLLTGSGTYTPSYSSGILNFYHSNGVYLINNNGVTKRTLEFKGRFKNYDYQKVGFADSSSLSTFIGFSLAANNTLKAVVNASSYSIGLSTVGSNTANLHTYKIEWGDTIKFYVDNILVITDSTNITSTLKPIIYNSKLAGGSYHSIDIDYILLQNPQLPLTEYISCTLDSTASNTQWGAVSYNGTSASGRIFKVSTRTSNDNSTWTEWSEINSDSRVTSSTGRYLQYKIQLSGIYSYADSSFEDIMISYLNP